MNLLMILLVLALIGTVGALGTGLISMMRGGDFDHKHSHQLMFARVGFQGVALVVLVIAIFATS